MANVALTYERQIPADKAFAEHDFTNVTSDGNSIVDNGQWAVSESASHPDRTLERVLKLDWQGRTYYRGFWVVFRDDSLEIEEVAFGDCPP